MARGSFSVALAALAITACRPIFGDSAQCSTDMDCAHFGPGNVCSPRGVCGQPADASEAPSSAAISPTAAASTETPPTPLADAGADAASPAQASITHVSDSRVLPQQNVTAIDLPTPANVTAGDVVVVGLFTDVAATTVTTPAGFTRIGDMAGPTDTHGWFYVRVVAAAEPTKTTFAIDPSTPFASAVAVAYRGVDPNKPIDASRLSTSNATTFKATSITTTSPATRLVALFLSDDTPAATWTAPTGMTARGNTGIVATYDERLTAAGATGDRTATSTTSAGGVNALVALAPLP